MAKRCPSCDCPQVMPLWLGTYGDMVTLILTFFILLLTMVTFDAKKLTEAEGSIRGSLSVLSGGIKIEESRNRILQQADITTDPETAEQIIKVQSEILEFKEDARVSLGPSVVEDDGKEGFILRFHGRLLFDEEKTTIENADEILFLKRLALILQKMPQTIHLDIIGYADNVEGKPNLKYQDSLGLSALRASNVAKILIENQVNPQKITSLGGGATNFLLPNTNAENRAQNRRVEFHFYPQDRHLHRVQNVLDKTKEQKLYEQSQKNAPTALQNNEN